MWKIPTIALRWRQIICGAAQKPMNLVCLSRNNKICINTHRSDEEKSTVFSWNAILKSRNEPKARNPISFLNIHCVVNCLSVNAQPLAVIATQFRITLSTILNWFWHNGTFSLSKKFNQHKFSANECKLQFKYREKLLVYEKK